MKCLTCLINFKNNKYLKKHRCKFGLDTLYCRANNISPVVLTPPKNSEETLLILSQLCKEDVVKMCILQGWFLPGVYPFCFPNQIRSGQNGNVPLLALHTASDNSKKLLKKMTEMEDEVKLPKHIIIRDIEAGLNAFLSFNVLTPPADYFSVSETSEFFFVSKDNNDDRESEHVDENSDYEYDSEDTDSDASDVQYACQRPEPTFQSENQEYPGSCDRGRGEAGSSNGGREEQAE